MNEAKKGGKGFKLFQAKGQGMTPNMRKSEV